MSSLKRDPKEDTIPSIEQSRKSNGDHAKILAVGEKLLRREGSLVSEVPIIDMRRGQVIIQGHHGITNPTSCVWVSIGELLYSMQYGMPEPDGQQYWFTSITELFAQRNPDASSLLIQQEPCYPRKGEPIDVLGNGDDQTFRLMRLDQIPVPPLGQRNSGMISSMRSAYAPVSPQQTGTTSASATDTRCPFCGDDVRKKLPRGHRSWTEAIMGGDKNKYARYNAQHCSKHEDICLPCCYENASDFAEGARIRVHDLMQKVLKFAEKAEPIELFHVDGLKIGRQIEFRGHLAALFESAIAMIRDRNKGLRKCRAVKNKNPNWLPFEEKASDELKRLKGSLLDFDYLNLFELIPESCPEPSLYVLTVLKLFFLIGLYMKEPLPFTLKAYPWCIEELQFLPPGVKPKRSTKINKKRPRSDCVG